VSRRHEQVAAEIRRALQAAIHRGLQDPRISGLITITSATVTQDFRTAHIAVSILPAEKQDLTMHGLKSAAGHLRHVIGDAIRLRQMPELIFRLDETLKKQAAVMEAINRASAQRAEDPRPDRRPEAETSGPDAYAQAPVPKDPPA
jgi:ribosome-binding factor A